MIGLDEIKQDPEGTRPLLVRTDGAATLYQVGTLDRPGRGAHGFPVGFIHAEPRLTAMPPDVHLELMATIAAHSPEGTWREREG